jgi:hypothetical protein
MNRKDNDSLSRMSSVGFGDNFKSTKMANVNSNSNNDDTTSNFTAVNKKFSSVFGPAPVK